jgi:hypothetical protein
MDRDTFVKSVQSSAPPSGLTHALEALWYAKKGDWHGAHERAQSQDDRDGAWVHAHLHRQEGDASNAAYWYRRAGRPVATQSLDEEWEALVAALLSKSGPAS